MINKLKRKIILVITLSLSVIILGISVFYSVSTYRGTVNSSGVMIDRFMGDRPDGIEKNENFKGEKPKEDEIPPEENTLVAEGVYRFLIDGSGNITNVNSAEEELIEYVKIASGKRAETGIVKNYIYRKMSVKDRETAYEITLIESRETVNRLNRNIALAAVICLISIVAVYFIAKQITKSIVKPVEETFEMQKQFISDASHELKTPLAVIEANTGVLESETGENKWINYIHNEIQSMNKLVNDLLLLAKTEGTDIVNITRFDLSQTVEIISAGFEGLAYEKGVTLKYDIQNGLSFNGDREDIKHILSTLIDNAIKHSFTGSDVLVSLKREKNEYIIKVKNKGEEIPLSDRDKIFERFYRVDKVRNREEKRYGLGLAIAKQAAEKYKGGIFVDCKNSFTEFTVKIYSAG